MDSDAIQVLVDESEGAPPTKADPEKILENLTR